MLDISTKERIWNHTQVLRNVLYRWLFLVHVPYYVFAVRASVLLYFICHGSFYFIASLEILDKVEVEYITLPGWKTSIQDCKTFDDLPANAQAYVRKVEELTQIPSML